MNRNKKISIFILVIFLLNIFPVYKVQAADDINIISDTVISKDDAKAWATKHNASQTFINLADLYWKYYKANGNVNPAVAYVQSAKETAFGNFGGVIDESFHNPCGLKTTAGGDNGDPNAHQRFNSWDEGVQAHLDHLALYAGASGYPRTTTYDPRHFASILGTATTVKALGGKWAPSTTYGDEILAFYNELYSMSSNKPAIINIDNPTYNQTISNNKLRIDGWALNASGVNQVKVYVDGQLQGNAQIGGSRPDVNAAFPGYLNGDKSGYNADIDLTTIAPGQRTITIEAIGNNGVSSKIETKINVAKKQIRMALDNPKYNQSVTDKLNVDGWVLNDSGVKTVNIYVDGQLKGNAQTGGNRPDVNAAFPGYLNGDKSGYNASIDVTTIAPGQRSITLEAIGNDGTSSKMETKVNVIKKDSRMALDGLKYNENVSDNLSIGGWALNPSGVKVVNIYIDGQLKGNTQTGGSRPDVNAAFPGYLNGDKSGYNANIDITTIAPGQRSVTVEAVGNDGTSTKIDTKINVIKKEARMALDYPSYNENITGNSLGVGGWALNPSGVKSVNIYIDGQLKGNASIGGNRPDVNAAFPGYVNGDKGGYNANIDITAITPGQRSLTVEAVGNDGTSSRIDTKINVVRKEARIVIDTPKYNDTVTSNSLTVSGWALNASGVKAVNVYVDGQLKANTQTGGNRPDVNAAIPGYLNGDKSGYTANLDLNTIAPGQRSITVEAIGNDGTSVKLDTKVNIVKSEARVWIDTPDSNTIYKPGTLAVNGWAVNASSVKEVKVYLDNQLLGNATLGGYRPDVYNAFPTYPNSNNAGVSYSVDTSSLSDGDHYIKMVATGFDSTTCELIKKFTIKKQLLIVIDPGHNYGGDYGAESTFNSVTYSETELNMQVAVKLQKNLSDMGYNVVMTRQPLEMPVDDYKTSLKKRSDLANSLKADLFISLHHNSVDNNTTVNGISTYYSTYKPGLKNVQADLVPLTSGYDGWTDTKPTSAGIVSRDFAKNVENSLTSNCKYATNGSDAGRVGYIDRNLSVTVNTNMPSVLIELGFISNPNEAKRCADQTEQQNKANVIANEVKKMF